MSSEKYLSSGENMTNINTLVFQSPLNKPNSEQSQTVKRLTADNDIKNEGADQASCKIKISELAQAALNINDDVLIIQTAERSLNDIVNQLLQIREAVVQSYNPTRSLSERRGMQLEIDLRMKEINRVLDHTIFDGQAIFKIGQLTLQSGHKDGETVTVNLQAINMRTLGLEDFKITGLQETVDPTYDPLQRLDLAIQKVDGLRSELDDVMKNLGSVG